MFNNYEVIANTAATVHKFSDVLVETAAFVELTCALHMMSPRRAVRCHWP